MHAFTFLVSFKSLHVGCECNNTSPRYHGFKLHLYIVSTNVFKVKPLSHRTALPQRLYSVLKPCQRAVGSPQNTRKNIKFVSYSVYTTSPQRPHNVPTASLQRPWRFHSAQAVTAACSQRAHSVLTAIIAFKIFHFFLLFWVTLFCKHSDLFLLFEAIRHRI